MCVQELERDYPDQVNPEHFAVNRNAPVKYIVQYPLNFDLGMHSCTERREIFCDLCEVYPSLQRAVGCIDEKPLEEPLAQYGIGVSEQANTKRRLVDLSCRRNFISLSTIDRSLCL